ncbi:MAG: hypothetical protein WCS72_17355 [Deltaproteobacteria bacterium]
MSTIREDDVEEEIDVVQVTITPPPAPPPAAPPNPVLARLLRMADGYRRSGQPYQAIEMYFELVDDHGETPQGIQAREHLMAVCEQYEQEGKMRQARALYERLL